MNSKKTIMNKPKQTKKDLKYREKIISTSWSCQICASINATSDLYCTNCLQTLYYYNYINRHLFVSKDEPYSQVFEPTEIKRKYSSHSCTTEDTCDDDFNSSDDESAHTPTQ